MKYSYLAAWLASSNAGPEASAPVPFCKRRLRIPARAADGTADVVAAAEATSSNVVGRLSKFCKCQPLRSVSSTHFCFGEMSS